MITEEKILTEQDDFPVEIFIRRNQEDKMVRNDHWHDCFELLYVLKGSAMYHGTEKSCPIQTGDFILIRCGEIHTVVCEPDADTDILVIKFMPSVISSPYHRLSDSSYISGFLNSGNIYHPEAEEEREIRGILEDIYTEYSRKQKAYELLVRSGVYRLIAVCIRYHMILLPGEAADSEYRAILPILRYIEQNYASDITLHQIADMLHLNYTYASRYFKKIVGRSFKQYLDYIRISEAEKMLLQDKEYAYLIAAKCGFSSQQSFIRTFKRLRGYSPKVKKC